VAWRDATRRDEQRGISCAKAIDSFSFALMDLNSDLQFFRGVSEDAVVSVSLASLSVSSSYSSSRSTPSSSLINHRGGVS
jgi:hypothetical protein